MIKYNNIFFDQFYLGKASTIKNMATFGDPDIFFIFDPQPGNYMPHDTIPSGEKA